MSILQKLNALKNNVFGGPGSTGPSPPIGRKSAIELAKTNPLIGKLDDDPFEFTSMVYPQSMSDYKQEGQYIIFYINTRNPSKYDTAMSASETAQTTRESYRGGQVVPTNAIKSVAVFTAEDAAREALRGRYSSPVYDQVKETATVTPGNELSTLDQIAETSVAAAAEAAAATQDSFRGRVTGPAAALIDSAAATRPTIADISGDLLSTATAASTAPARPNIAQMTDSISKSKASAAAATRESFRGKVTATTAAQLEERAASTRESFRGVGETATQLAERAATTRESYRGQVLNPAATTTGLPYNMSNVAGPLKRKLKVVTSAGRGHSTKGKNSKKKHTVRDSEGTDLSLEKQKSTGGMNSYADLTTRIQTSIALYLPPNIESKYSVNYNTAETGTLGFMAASAAGVIGSAQKADQKSLAKQIMGVVGSTLTDVGLKVGGELASAAGLGEGGAALGAKFFGIASNPYMEVLFENPAMREFTYSFNFTPKSQKETQEIKEIIETFRTHMAPELKSDFSRYMMLPSEFDIHYVYQDGESDAKENTYMNKIATCVLKDCSVNYHPNGEVQVHADGSPVSINMSLTFAETEMITKEKIKQGF